MRTRTKRLWLAAIGSLLLCAALSCSQSAPFAIITLNGLGPDVASLHVSARLGDSSRSIDFSGADPLDRFSLSFPASAQGQLQLEVAARNGSGCIVATGTAQVEITANQTYDAMVTLTPLATPVCTAPGEIPLILEKHGDGQGLITSTPTGIDCGAGCSMQSAGFAANSTVTLNAKQAVIPGRNDVFTGWLGAGCSGTGSCVISLSQVTILRATFACKGFCVETPPSELNTLRAVWGSSAASIIAVGDNGTILRWNGQSWSRISAKASDTLRAVSGIEGGQLAFAVGDGGAILQTVDGGQAWSVVKSGVTANLRGVYVASSTEAYAVGDNLGSNQPFLSWNGSDWSVVSVGGLDLTWNAVHGYGSQNFLVVGNAAAQVRYENGVPSTAPGITSAQHLNGAWSADALDLFAVGNNGALFKYDEGSWLTLSVPAGASAVNLHAVYGTRIANVFAVGDGGAVWRFTGTAYSVMTTGVGTNLYGVWALNDGNIWAVGQGGLILHYRP